MVSAGWDERERLVEVEPHTGKLGSLLVGGCWAVGIAVGIRSDRRTGTRAGLVALAAGVCCLGNLDLATLVINS